MSLRHSPSNAPTGRRRVGLAQMGALTRLGIVLPVICVIWLVLWLLVQS